MSDATEVTLADAVVEQLNSSERDWSLPFLACRSWLPVYSADELKKLQVSVIPTTLSLTPLARGVQTADYTIEIDLQQRVDSDCRAAIDRLSRLAEEIHDFYRPLGPTVSIDNGFYVADAQRENIYSPEFLYSDHVWNTLITLTVRGRR